jgi:hypothetical protein
MINSNEYVPVGVLVIAAFATPVVPWTILKLLDYMLVNVFVVVALLMAISYGPATGIMALILAAMLYMERNRQKVVYARMKFTKIMEAKKDNQATVEEEGKPQETVPVVEFDEPEDDNMIYLPGKGTGSNKFQRIPFSENLNDKEPLPTVPIGAKSAPIFKDYLN